METTITPDTELDSKYQFQWKRSQVAMEQKNWDYAIDLLLPIVKEAPAFLTARKNLRTAEVSAAGSRKPFSLGLNLLGHLSKVSPWETVADLEEKVFLKAPLNTTANQKLHDLATQLHFPDLASFALETILTAQPENTQAMHALARHHLAQGQPAKAAEIYAAIVKLDPRDMTAAKGEKDAIARVSIERGGWDQDGDFHTKTKNDEAGRILANLGRQGRTPEQTQELVTYFTAQYEQDPANLTCLKTLGLLHAELSDLDLGLKFYAEALAQSPGDSALAGILNQMHGMIETRYLQQLEAWIAANPESEGIEQAKADLAERRRQCITTAIAEAKTRVQRNPTDKQAHYDLAQAYFDAGMFSEAIPQCQQAKANPHVRIKAMFLLGCCYEKKDMDDLAQLALEETLQELPVMDDLKKEVLYFLALVHEKLDAPEASLTALKELYHADYSYRDVAQRVEASYAKKRAQKAAS